VIAGHAFDKHPAPGSAGHIESRRFDTRAEAYAWREEVKVARGGAVAVTLVLNVSGSEEDEAEEV